LFVLGSERSSRVYKVNTESGATKEIY